MASRIQTIVTCDLHNDGTDASDSISFALGMTTYEVDLCETHVVAMHDAFEPFIEVARKLRGPKAHRPKLSVATEATETSPRLVRVWAQQNGFTVSDRGRIPEQVMNAYMSRASRAS